MAAAADRVPKPGHSRGAEHQARRAPQAGAGVGPGDALAAINVDQALTNGVLDKLQGLPDVLDVRLANFGD